MDRPGSGAGSPVADQIRDRWHEVFAEPCRKITAERLAETHWPLGLVDDVAALARHAVTRDTGIARSARGFAQTVNALAAPGELERLVTALAAGTLVNVALTVRLHGLIDWSAVYRWLIVVAADAEQRGWLKVITLAEGEAPGPDGDWDERGLREWIENLPSDIAPLAWAGGLSADEALTRYRSGVLGSDELLMLAGLRGFTLP